MVQADQERYGPLLSALEAKRSDIVRILIDHKAEVNKPPNPDRSFSSVRERVFRVGENECHEMTVSEW